jgi:hypothetical protein
MRGSADYHISNYKNKEGERKRYGLGTMVLAPRSSNVSCSCWRNRPTGRDATRRDAARSLQAIKHQKDEIRFLYATAIGWTILIQA